MFQIANEEQQGDFQGPWKKRTNLRLEKDYSREGSQGRITRKNKTNMWNQHIYNYLQLFGFCN